MEATCGHDDHKSKSRDSLGEEYGLSGSTVARMLRVNQLIPEMKDKLDNGEINLMAAVQMSYVPEEIQRAAVETGKPISRDVASRLRNEDVTVDSVKNIVCRSDAPKTKKIEKSVRLPVEIYERFFQKEDAVEVAKIIEAALEAWFAGKEDADVHRESAGTA